MYIVRSILLTYILLNIFVYFSLVHNGGVGILYRVSSNVARPNTSDSYAYRPAGVISNIHAEWYPMATMV